MAVSFSIDIKKISRAGAIAGALRTNLANSLGVSSITQLGAALVKMGPRKALDAIRKTTKPTHVRFYNPDPVTDVCQSLNGEVWKIGDPDIQMPPLHHNCKSVLIFENRS
jgi:hypothetical protein